MDQGCLSRDDFEGAPISLDEIEPNLWLGNVSAAKNVDTLVDYGITDVLTVDAVALPDTVRQLRWLTNKYVKLNDVAKEDILSRLEECIAFISAALGGRRKVLVHCYFGVSRSAAIVIGYIMHKYQLTYEQAFQHVKAKRPAISPNAGFVQQLTLFFEMHWCIDSRHQIYKSFQLRMAAMEIQKLTAGPANFKHLIREDPAVATYSPELELNTRPALNYRCRKCRRTLATDAQHIQHVAHSTAANQSSAYDEHNGLLADILVANGGARVTNGLICTDSIFIEPIAWMTDVAQQRQGKLHCPKCETKVGSFNWVSGSICPCGTVVAPAFYLVPSKVELSRRLIGGRYKV